MVLAAEARKARVAAEWLAREGQDPITARDVRTQVAAE
jgi:hypothetical protein